MGDKNTVATKTVAACQTDLELPITTVIIKAERYHVIFLFNLYPCIFSELQSEKSSVFTLL